MFKKFISFFKNKQQKCWFYLAGSMSGKKDHNYPTFHKYSKILRDAGYTVWCPAENNKIGTPPYKCMANDLNAIINLCNMIVLLPGEDWKSSVGVSTELMVAHVCRKKVYQIIEEDGSWFLRRIYTKDTRPYCETNDKDRNDSIYTKLLMNS